MTHESAIPPRPLGTVLSSRAPERQRAAARRRAELFEVAERNRVVTAVLNGHRHYDPGLVPADENLYVGTGIGALYNLGGTQHLWQLAGWTLPSCALLPDE